MMDTSTDIIVTAKAGISAKRKARGAVLRGLMYFSAQPFFLWQSSVIFFTEEYHM